MGSRQTRRLGILKSLADCVEHYLDILVYKHVHHADCDAEPCDRRSWPNIRQGNEPGEELNLQAKS